MKTRILVFILSLLTGPACVHAQATRSIPLGKHLGLDTHIPVQTDMSTVNTALNRQLANIQTQAARQAQAQHSSEAKTSLRLNKEDFSEEDKDYVVTPEGNIAKGSWQACQYFFHWKERQVELGTLETQLASTQEMLLAQFDISDDYCRVLAQQHTSVTMHLANVPATPVTPEDLTISLNPNVQLPVIHLGEVAASHPIITEEDIPHPTIQSQVEMNQISDIPSNITPRKAKRYLKHFVRDNYNELHLALENQKSGQRLPIAQRRLLSSYESLCSWYEGTHHTPCPSPEVFL